MWTVSSWTSATTAAARTPPTALLGALQDWRSTAWPPLVHRTPDLLGSGQLRDRTPAEDGRLVRRRGMGGNPNLYGDARPNKSSVWCEKINGGVRGASVLGADNRRRPTAHDRAKIRVDLCLVGRLPGRPGSCAGGCHRGEASLRRVRRQPARRSHRSNSGAGRRYPARDVQHPGSPRDGRYGRDGQLAPGRPTWR